MTAPYRLMVTWRDGRVETAAEGHSPSIVREAESRVARNPRVIARIELHDLEGPVETIWAASWATLDGVDP